MSPVAVRVKAVDRKPEPTDHYVVEASAAVAIVCGADPTTADSYSEDGCEEAGKVTGSAIVRQNMV